MDPSAAMVSAVDPSAAVAFVGSTLGLIVLIAAAATALTVGGLRGQIANLKERNAGLELEVADWKRREETKGRDLQDEVDRNTRQQSVNDQLKGQVATYERAFGLIEGPIADLAQSVERNHLQLTAHHQEAVRGIRRLVRLMLDQARILGDKRPHEEILEEVDGHD